MAEDRKYGFVQVPGVPDDEPVFILRAQDSLAVGIIARYRNQARAIENRDEWRTDEWFAGVDAVIEDFGSWQQANSDKVKLPD